MKDQEINSTMLAQERTLLAAERTYSAWLRTALAAMAGGIAILRLISFKTDIHRIIGHIIGETLIIWGCLLIVFSSIDYKKIHSQLIVKNYKSSPWGFMIIVLPLLIISTLLIVITLP